MFYILSKIVWLILTPSNFIALTIAVGAVLAMRYRRAGAAISAVGVTALLVCGFSPIGVP